MLCRATVLFSTSFIVRSLLNVIYCSLRNRLANIRKKEQDSIRAMKAKNELESTVFAMYDKLEEENVGKVATAEAVCACIVYFSRVVPLSNCRCNECHCVALYREVV